MFVKAVPVANAINYKNMSKREEQIQVEERTWKESGVWFVMLSSSTPGGEGEEREREQVVGEIQNESERESKREINTV